MIESNKRNSSSPSALRPLPFALSPLVSVGLPTFNRAGSLKQAIESVLAQGYTNLELVISDNASSDQTQSLCADYYARDKRIRYIRQPTNRGATANFMEVLNHSQGQYFMWLGDDDWLHPSYISRCLETLEANSDFSVVCGTAKYYEEGKLAFEGVKLNLAQESPTERVLAFYRQVSDNGTLHGLMRREVLVKVPLQNILACDWLLMASLAMKGKILTLEDVLIYRSRLGASAKWESVVVLYGLSKEIAKKPFRTITANVFKDILTRSPIYAELGTLG